MNIKIIGGGIAGLAAAWYLRNLGKVTLYEKSGRVGGWIETVHHNGFCFEKGPRGFRPSGNGKATLALCRELGLELIPADRAAKRRYICRNGELEQLTLGKLAPALWRDLFARLPQEEDETLEHFFGRHLGKRATARYIDPFARGIFAGDYRELSARSCFPTLWKARSFLLMQRESKPPASLYGFREGMESLPKALAQHIDIRLNEEVKEIEGDIVIWATPRAPKRASIKTISLGWEHAPMSKQGYGFLIPSSEGGNVWGMTWDSQIFPQQAGATRLCVMGEMGMELEEALEMVERHVGISQQPDAVLISESPNAIPQYALGHHRWVEEVEGALPKHHYVIGSHFRGVGINDCIADARRLMEKIT